jgi:hypothetical protein
VLAGPGGYTQHKRDQGQPPLAEVLGL